MSRKYVLILVGVMLVSLAIACDSDSVSTAGLPEGAKQALDECIESHVAYMNRECYEHWGAYIFSYNIVSYRRATNSSYEEEYCITIDTGLRHWPCYGDSHTTTHFFAHRTGLKWEAWYTTSTNEDMFLTSGCDNWND